MIELFVCGSYMDIPRDYFIVAGENCSIYLRYDPDRLIEERLNNRDEALLAIQKTLMEEKANFGEVSQDTAFWADYLNNNLGNVFDRISHVTFYTTLKEFEDSCHKEPRLYKKDSKLDTSYNYDSQYRMGTGFGRH